MIEAKDVLLIVLAFCALWFTAFACWLIYQVAMILKNMNDVVADVRETLGKMERAMTGIRGKFDGVVSGLMLAFEGGQKLIELLGKQRTKKNEKKKNLTGKEV
jgi:hypothetical protein